MTIRVVHAASAYYDRFHIVIVGAECMEHEAGWAYRVHVYAGSSSSMHCASCQASKMNTASMHDAFDDDDDDDAYMHACMHIYQTHVSTQINSLTMRADACGSLVTWAGMGDSSHCQRQHLQQGWATFVAQYRGCWLNTTQELIE